MESEVIVAGIAALAVLFITVGLLWENDPDQTVEVTTLNGESSLLADER